MSQQALQCKILALTLILLGYILVHPGYPQHIDQPTARTDSYSVTGKEATKMSTEQIIERITQKDQSVLDDKKQITPETASAIAELLDNEDHEVRRLVLETLDGIDSQEARRAIITGLRDKNINVRSLACRLLLTNYDKEDLPRLTRELSLNGDEMAREHVALVLGRIQNEKATKPLLLQFPKEIDLDAQHAMHLALVRLEDQNNQNEYIRRLEQTDPKQKARALKDFIYIEDRKFLVNILPLLDDDRKAINVGKSNRKMYIRVCDVAINVLDDVLNHPFDFDIFPRKLYTPEEIVNAKKVITNML